MALGKDIFELAVEITALDHFTRPLREAQRSMSAFDKDMLIMQKTMKQFGKSDDEIRKLTSDFQKLQRAADFSKMANDLKKVGMASKDIDKIKDSYEKVIKAQEDHARQTQRLQDLSSKGTRTMTYGVGVTGASTEAAHSIWDWLKEAGDFQNKLVSIGAITGSNADEMDNFGNKIMEVSRQVSKFNDLQLADMAQVLASGGFNKDQINQLLLPTAQFSEVQEYTGKASAEESARNAVEMAHLMGHYDPQSFYKFLNQFNKYSLMQPGSSGDLMQTLTYLAPTAIRQMKMSEDDVMTMSALANMVGLTGSHGGTNAADMVLRLIPGLVGGMPTAKKTPKAWEAMKELGFLDNKGRSVFFDNSGHLVDLQSMLGYFVNASQEHSPEELAKLYHDMLGIQGGRAASILGDPKTIELMEKVISQKKQIDDLEPYIKKLQDTTGGKQNLFDSNKMSLMINLSKELAKTMNPVLDDMNDLLKKTLEFTQQHPYIAKMVTEFLAMGTAAGLILGPMATLAGGIMALVANWKLCRTAAAEAAAAEEAASIAGAGLLKTLGLLSVVGGIAWIGSEISDRIREQNKNAMPVRDMNALTGSNINKTPSGAPKGYGDQHALQDYLTNTNSYPNQSFHNLMNLSQKAWGGFVNHPVIAGEDGPEAIIPLSKRNRGIDLWQKTGEALGAESNNNGGIYVSEGAIVIQSNQDPKEIAREVLRQLGKISRGSALNKGIAVNISSMG